MNRPNSEAASSFDLSAEEFDRVGQKVLASMWEAIQRGQENPILAPARGGDVRALLEEPLPRQGVGLDEVVASWVEQVLPLCRHNGHPRFFGYVVTSPDPIGIFADAMASAMNQGLTAWRSAPGATEVERLVLKWLDELVGFSGSGSGILTSGGSSANFHALACAVHRADASGAPRDKQTIYMSCEAHVSMRKAARVLGLPKQQIRLIAVDERRRLRTDLLQAELERDRAAGLVPAAVCASAGGANTGAIDPLEEIADLCESRDLWLHIDGAYGAPASATSRYSWMREPFARADSLSLDPHKWLFAPVDVGCLLLRDEEWSREVFGWESEYTKITQTDPIERFAFFDHGLEMTRRFRSLKVWSILKARGADGIVGMIERDIRLREELDARVELEPDLQSLGSELSISCFRYRAPSARTELEIDTSNRQILETIVREGSAYMSPTYLEGRYALRACIVNFRTQSEDVQFLLDEVLRIGRAQ
jgi:glutamate/tyrosine decarboxylase-like PLP-dependent enzyme